MRLVNGTRLGPYEVLAFIGSGGMAEVYRAKDTRLQREVAVKVVGAALSADGDFLSRLTRAGHVKCLSLRGGAMRHGLMLTCVALCACGGGNTTISISTKPTSIPAGSTFEFMAGTQHNHGNDQLPHGYGQGANWTLTPATGEGTLSNYVNNAMGAFSQITYTAPATTCSNCVRITATSVENPSASDSSTFSIAP